MTFKKQLLPDLVVVANSDGRVSGDGREECRRDRLAVAGQRANGRQRLRVGPENNFFIGIHGVRYVLNLSFIRDKLNIL